MHSPVESQKRTNHSHNPVSKFKAALSRIFVTTGVLVSVATNALADVGNNGFFQPDANNRIVMEAEHFDFQLDQGGRFWIPDYTSGYVGDSAMLSDPNSWLSINENIATTSPRMDYEVEYSSQVNVYVWIRGNGPSGSRDSIWVGIDNDDTNVIRIDPTRAAWGWERENTQLTIPAGVHTFNIWMREDGTIVDRIILTTDSTYTPTGDGPAESPRSGGGNSPPTAQNDSFTVFENSTNNAFAVLQDNGNGLDSDPDSDPVTVSSVVSPGSAGSTVVVNATNDGLLYSPNVNFTGNETFDYTISDGNGGTDTGQVSVTVIPNSPPVLNSIGNKSIADGQTLSFTVTATDPDAPPNALLSADLTNLSGTPTFADNGDGTADFSWTPAPSDAPGTYDITVTATDSLSSSLTDDETLTISVLAGGGSGAFQPDANGMVVMEMEHYDLNVSQGDRYWIPDYTSGYVGDSAMLADPNSWLSVNENIGTSSPRMDYAVEYSTAVDLNIWVRGNGPSGSRDSIWVGVDNDDSNVIRIDPTRAAWGWETDGVKLSVPAGVHTINIWMREDGTIVDRLLLTPDNAYTPTGNGPAESVRGGGGNNSPVAYADSFAVDQDTTGNVLSVLADNGSGADYDPDSDPLSITAVDGSGSAGGSISINGSSNALVYAPASSYVGQETFNYTISDGLGGSGNALVTVTVNSTSSAPSTPTGLSGPSTDSDGDYTVSWNSSSGSTSYELEEQDGPWSQIYSGSDTSFAVVGNTDGSYTYRVRGCDSASICSSWSSTHSVSVSSIPQGTPATPPSALSNNDPGQGSAFVTDTDSIGTISGNFRVDEAGAATYSIPIATAPGTAGVAPQISLNYSSSAGNGIAGQGWSVGGVSAISRCRRTLDQDNSAGPIGWSWGDRFCLDGQRLVLEFNSPFNYGDVNAVYRTEIASGAIVISRGGSAGKPDYFEVKRKDGSISFYGESIADPATQSAKLENGSGDVLTWSIRQFQDSVGNSIWFDYLSANGSQRVTDIKYAYGSSPGPSGHAARVEFVYETRPDVVAGYVGGSLFENDQRLSSIRSYNNTSESLIREYDLNYQAANTVLFDELSRLASITECIGSTCLPATTFNWVVPSNVGNFSEIASASFGSDYSGFTPADINGDGQMDLVWMTGGGASKTLAYRVSNGSGFSTGTFTNNSATIVIGSSVGAPKITAIDYNLDGRQDIAWWNGSLSRWQVSVSTPNATGGWQLSSTQLVTPISTSNVSFVDVDSNGTTDAVASFETFLEFGIASQLYLYKLEPVTPGSNLSSSTYYGYSGAVLISGSGVEATIGHISSVGGDFNGDGQVDIVMAGSESWCDELNNCNLIENYRVLTLNGTTGNNPSVSTYYSLPSSALQYSDSMLVGDINADGLSDLFYQIGTTTFRTAINKGNGVFENISVPYTGLTAGDAKPALLDWNMDGHADVMFKEGPNGSRIIANFWNPAIGDFDASIIVTGDITASTSEIALYLDANGDAMPDIFKLNADGVGGAIEVLTRSQGSNGDVPINRIDLITNGLGAYTQIDYEPLSTSSHYDRLEVTNSPQTQTVCENLGDPIEEFCWEESVQAANLSDFYTTINGDWQLAAGTNTLGKNSPVLELSGPMYVVTAVTGSAPTAGATPNNVATLATSSIEYFYSEAKLQAAGRGFLGFQRLKTVDIQTGVETTTRYRQDWPFLGSPVFTEVESVNGSSRYVLSQTTTEWEILEWSGSTPTTATNSGTAALGPLHVVRAYSGEQTYDLANNGTAQGALLKTISTATGYDVEGNADLITVTTQRANGTALKIVTTDNVYDSTSFALFDARLTSSTVNTTYDDVVAPTRTSTFDYYLTGNELGLLRYERVLWTDSLLSPSSRMLETTHSYDSWGNRVQSSTSDGSETRCAVVTSVYDSRGRYVDTTRDCLGRTTSTVTNRNIFGEPTSINTYVGTGGNDYVISDISYSALGREYYRYSGVGSQASKFLSSDLTYCPTGTVFRSVTSDASGASSAECLDVLSRPVRTMSLGFDGAWNAQDTEYDELGRVKRTSEPFDLPSGSSAAAYWTVFDYDILGRVTYTNLPENGAWSSTTYAGLTTTITSDGGSAVGGSQDRIEVRNEIGEVVTVTDNLGGVTQFNYDYQGNLRTMTDNPGSNVTVMTYDELGRKRTMDDPDKGDWVYIYNDFGELITQTDAKGQIQTMTYDGLGRMKTRVDADSNTVWTYDTAPYGLGQLDNVQDTQSGYMQTILYDDLGRADEVITNFDGGIYYEKTTYDAIGRVFQVFDAAGDGQYNDQGVVNEYNAYGYLESVSDAVLVGGVSRTTYRKVTTMNARNQVEFELRGIDNLNGGQASVSTDYDYYDATGRIWKINGTNASAQDVQNLEYEWDTIGNLENRKEFSGSKNLTEDFVYDGLNRLTDQTVAGQGTVTVVYDAMGNITSKSDVGSYTEYGTKESGCSVTAGPHAVTRIAGQNYCYDENGNNISGDGRSINFSAFDKPESISKGGHTTSFAYGTDRARYRRIDSGPAGTTLTRYIGNVEMIFHANGNQDRKRYIAGVAVETIHFGQDTVEDYRETHYLHKDHLGSLDVVTDAFGSIVSGMDTSFDAWGARRSGIDWTTWAPTQQTTFDHSITTRGFTGHEMLDEVGIIHMNGRIYDHTIARFLQADPIIQDPMNTQSLNRYSYVWNNPLNATDPSGYFANFFAAAVFGSIFGALGDAADIPVLSAIGSTLLCAGSGGVACAATFSFASTLGAGGNLGDAFNSGLLSGLSATAFSAVGNTFTGTGFLAEGGVGHIGAHGVVGGMLSELQGGKFGNGFISASLTKAANVNRIIGLEERLMSVRITAAAIIGGSISGLTGGKFSNGAATAAFAQAYNGESEAYKSRIASNKPFFRLHGKWEASLDILNDNAYARHEFHVFHKGQEVGVYSNGRFVGRHNFVGDVIPDGMTPQALKRLNGLDIDMMVRAQTIRPKSDSSNNKHIFRRLMRVIGWVAAADLANEIIQNPTSADETISEVIGVTPMGDGSLHPPVNDPIYQ